MFGILITPGLDTDSLILDLLQCRVAFLQSAEKYTEFRVTPQRRAGAIDRPERFTARFTNCGNQYVHRGSPSCVPAPGGQMLR